MAASKKRQARADKASPFKKWYDKIFINKRDTPASSAVKKRRSKMRSQLEQAAAPWQTESGNMSEDRKNYLKTAERN